MAIIYEDKNKTFYLETKLSSMVLQVNGHGYLTNLYFGKKIGRDDMSYILPAFDRGFSANFGGANSRKESLDTTPLEFPIFGNGDFRHSAILTLDGKGNRLENLLFSSYKILKEKPLLKGLPSLRGKETLVITLKSENLSVELIYSVYEETDSIVRSAKVYNTSQNIIRIQRLMSCSLDLPDYDYDMITLHGRHCNEGNIDRTPLRHGINSIYSNRGASSLQHNPFMCIAQKNAGEYNGEAYAFNYVYGGSFLMSAEVDQFNITRIQTGFNPFDFCFSLDKGESLETPETVIVYTCDGFNSMSQKFHDLYREYLINPDWVKKTRPIIINSWEAVYFNFDNEKLIEIIDGCKGLGFDTFVLDDGWFGKRNSDTSGLGDWFVNEDKLKGGLKRIIDKCKSENMKFGLWIEPEMINEDSDLYRKHPDWCIHIEGKPHTTSRSQLVLDLSRKDVVEYLKNTFAGILKNNKISYIKWDFNRHIADACSAMLPADRQQEIYHRFMLGFYELAGYLTSEFRHVLFEGCSGGGGRNDAGMLPYFPLVWTSDCSDAFERTKIQHGVSMCYPLSMAIGHVSVIPNHQTGRTTPFNSRANIASLANLGYELNPKNLSESDRVEIKANNERYRKIAPLILDGDLYRLSDSTSHKDWFAAMVVSKDKKLAFFTALNGLVVPNPPTKRLKLRGLDDNKNYLIQELNLVLSGKTLNNAGIPLPQCWGDHMSVAYIISQVD